jgi:hypothetical protein
VDGRFFADAGHEVVVQAKHWEKTGINPLLKHLRDREAPKVTKLSPHRYIFATSVPLSRTDKQAIAALFAPHIQTPSDFFGNEDIQDFLRDPIGVRVLIKGRRTGDAGREAGLCAKGFDSGDNGVGPG